MAGLWWVITPEAATNKVLNPSAEAAGNFGLLQASPSVSPSASASISPSGSASPSASASISPSASASRSPSASASPSGSASPSASVSPSPSASAGLAGVDRVTTHARAGDYCWYVNGAGTYGGGAWTLSALTNAAHYVSLYARGNAGATLEVSLDGVHYYVVAAIGGATGGWVRYGVSIAAAEANGSTTLYIRNSADEDYYLDCLQVEANSYGTTYIDGDQPGCKWAGLRHGSASSRDAQYRLGGRIQNLQDDFGAEVVEGTRRHGMPLVTNNLLGQALLPGAHFQSTKIQPREIDLRLLNNPPAESWAGLHGWRQDLIDLVKPDRTRGAQAFALGYSGADSGTVLWGAYRYASGLEFGDFLGYTESPSIRLTAVDPFWYEDNRETSSLDFTDSVADADDALYRLDGAWTAFGTGFNGTVYAMAVDRQRGRVYFVGSFTTGNGVTLNRVGYWNGSTFVAMDGGVNGVVICLAIAANGDVWIGGEFTTVGSGAAATKGLALWDVSAGSWTAFNESTASFAGIYSIVIDQTGKVYIAGIFTDWEGDTAIDYIASTANNGTDWDAVGTEPFSSTLYINNPTQMAVDASGNLWTGSTRSGAGTVSLFKWDGSSWTTVGTSDSQTNPTISSVFVDADGQLYLGGAVFTTLGGVSTGLAAVYNGTTFVGLGSGLSGNITGATTVQGIKRVGGLIYFVGDFTSASGATVAGIAGWNGYTFVAADIVPPSTPVVRDLTEWQDVLYIAFDTTGTATAAGRTTVSPTATATTHPTVTVIGPTTANTSCTLQWLENQSTGERMYFDLDVLAGETVYISTNPAAPSVVSDWRGQITDQPLQNSDGFSLLPEPAANRIAAFITGTVTGVSLLLHYQPRHHSADGPA